MLNFDQIDQALQAPTMEAVIALSERVQTLEANPKGMVYTMLRDIDNTLILGYSDQLEQCSVDCSERGFRIIEARRGTRREQRLLLLTLDELGLQSSYGPDYFDADIRLIRHLNQLGWPIGDLHHSRRQKITADRPDRLFEEN